MNIQKTDNIIPVMHCFNNNYVLPAGISFFSMLKNANSNYFYKLYVLHSDITSQNQEKLMKIVSEFANASLQFINVNNKFDSLFKNIKNKNHYSKEMFLKFLAPVIFEEYDKIIITDVDVVFLNDISKDFIGFDTEADYYLAGITPAIKKNSWLETYMENFYKKFSSSDKQKLLTCAGYWIFNLKNMRKDNCSDKFIKFARENSKKLVQPEQDTVNIICYPKIKLLSLNALVCSYLYNLYKNEDDLNQDLHYKKEELEYALKHPVQLHYATNKKPWNSCARDEEENEQFKIWYQYLIQTSLFKDYLNLKEKRKKIFSFSIPLLKKTISIYKEKT